MANPLDLLTEERLQQLIDESISRAIARHELRFSLHGLPLVAAVVVGLWLAL